MPGSFAALRAALASLEARWRALLRYPLLDGWSIDQVGKLDGVRRACRALAHRRPRGARPDHPQRARRAPEIAAEEVDSIVRWCSTGSTMSLDRLLVPNGSP